MFHKFLIKFFGLRDEVEDQIKSELFIEPQYVYCTELEEKDRHGK